MNYREIMQESRMSGKAMPYSFEDYSPKEVGKKLKVMAADTGREGNCNRMPEEPGAEEDMLLLIKKEEHMEKGIYSWNRPPMDMAVVASPVLMALILGEYELAVELDKHREAATWQYSAEEMYQKEEEACLGGGMYTFGEALLMCGDAPKPMIEYFESKGCYDRFYANDEEDLFKNFVFHKDSPNLADVIRPFAECKCIEQIVGEKPHLLHKLLMYGLEQKSDILHLGYWDELFRIFTQKEERMRIMTSVFYYGLWHRADKSQTDGRVQIAMLVYFKKEKSIEMSAILATYIRTVLLSDYQNKPAKTNHLLWIFKVMKKVEGVVTREWQEGMKELLKLGDWDVIEPAFRCGYLKADGISEYIEALLAEQNHTQTLIRLIKKKWREEAVQIGLVSR